MIEFKCGFYGNNGTMGGCVSAHRVCRFTVLFFTFSGSIPIGMRFEKHRMCFAKQH